MPMKARLCLEPFDNLILAGCISRPRSSLLVTKMQHNDSLRTQSQGGLDTDLTALKQWRQSPPASWRVEVQEMVVARWHLGYMCRTY